MSVFFSKVSCKIIRISGVLILLMHFNVVMGNLPNSFTTLTTRDGLGSNNTNSIVQDKHGFIWIGTQEGLCRFDGFRFNFFQRDQTQHSLSSNNISALLSDGQYIWVGTWDGLNKININSFETHRINTGSSRVIRALHKATDDRLWIGTSNGVLIYNNKSGEFRHLNTNNSNLSHNTVRSFYETDNGDIWIGTFDKLNRYRDGHITIFDLKGNYKPLLENNLILEIKPYSQSSDSLLWIGTETGLALFNTYTGHYLLYNTSNTGISNEVIKSIYLASDSLLWLGTDFGLNLFNTRSLTVETIYHDPLIDHTIASNVIWEIYEDRQNQLWVITSNGVSIADKIRPLYNFYEQYFSLANPRIGNQLRDILIDRDGNIWMATIHGVVRKGLLGGSIKTFNTSSPPHERILLNNVYALMEDKQGRIWIGTAGGINIWEPARGRMHSITVNNENGLLSNYISSFASDCDGNIWVTAWEGGLFRIIWNGVSPETMRFKLMNPDGNGRLVSTGGVIYYGSGNNLWAMDFHGLQKTLIVPVNKALLREHITGLMADSQGSIWIGTSSGILRYFPKNESLTKIPIYIARPQGVINLQEDLNGYIWATTYDAIIRLRPADMHQTLLPVNRNMPMQGFYPFCSAITKDGEIFFGGDNGFIQLDPNKIYLGNEIPQIYISSFFVNNQKILPADTIPFMQKDIAFTSLLRLAHNQNSVTLEFSTLEFLYPEFVQFQYRLLPDRDLWQYTTGDRNFAVFANLRPGDYKFEVRGTDRFGRWSEIKSLPITITPSMWLSTPLISAYLLLFALGAWYAYRVYRNRRRLRQELLAVKLEQQHRNALFQAKIKFFTNISHEFRTPLSLILPPITELLKGGKNMENREKLLKIASRNAQRLYKLVNQLLDFRKIESDSLELVPTSIELISFCREIFHLFEDMAVRHETDYYFKSNVPELCITADSEKLETIIFNLLSNAFKYTPNNGTVGVEINHCLNEKGNNEVQIIVKDSGVGIAKEDHSHIFELFYQTTESKSLKKGSGLGLTIAQEYARLHGGKINVDSDLGHGSKFIYSFEVKNAVQPESGNSTSIENSFQLQPIQPKSLEKPSTTKKILIVDDNSDILEFMELNLQGLYQIFLAKNGAEAWRLIEKDPPHLVVSDVMMPVKDGLELCKLIKENKSTMHIPVILLTARAMDMHKTEGINKGADLYITKPFDVEYLKSSIAGIFRREKQMNDYIKNQLMLGPKEDDKGYNQDNVFLKKVLSLIENNISNPDLSVEVIADSMGMSATHLYRKLKLITGYSTKEIIMNFRMQKAALMISNNEGNISDIMYAVGFSSLSGFSRSFKAKFNVSPTTYKVPDAVES